MNNFRKLLLYSFLYSFITLLITFRFIGMRWQGYCITAGVILFVGICVCIYYYFEKLNEKLEKIEKQLKSENKADEDSAPTKQESKD